MPWCVYYIGMRQDSRGLPRKPGRLRLLYG
jgi:hypothetical protein